MTMMSEITGFIIGCGVYLKHLIRLMIRIHTDVISSKRTEMLALKYKSRIKTVLGTCATV